MTSLTIAIRSELFKLRKSRICIASGLLFCFVGVILGLLVYVASHPEIGNKSALLSAKASFIGQADFSGYMNLLIQVILTLGSIGFGVIITWIFGREFSDRVLKDLLALPVSRTQIVWAKFIVATFWSIFLSFLLLCSGLITGILVGIPGWASASLSQPLIRYFLTVLLTMAISTPVALVASIGRGYLVSFTYLLLTVIFTQLVCIGLPDLAMFFPWAVPALFSGVAGPALPSPGLTGIISLTLCMLIGVVGTRLWWRHADHY